MKLVEVERSRVAGALLLSLLLAVAGCAGPPVLTGDEGASAPKEPGLTRAGPVQTEPVAGEKTRSEETTSKELTGLENSVGAAEKSGGPEEENKGGEGFPEYRGWHAEDENTPPVQPVSSGTSAGAIPAVKPFNFGRDPGGPEDKMLYLTIPKLGLQGVTVFNSVSEEKLMESTVHLPATGFPWQKGANVFIAGHRIGYPGTGSFRIFYDVPELAEGDEIVLEDSAGGVYVYRVIKQEVVGPKDVDLMNPVEGKSLITLQTCTLPDYSERILVQGELVEKEP